jgi:hypothetical protein
VSADYSFNFVSSRSSFAVVAEASGTPLVHYSIEIDPQNFSMETDEKQSVLHHARRDRRSAHPEGRSSSRTTKRSIESRRARCSRSAPRPSPIRTTSAGARRYNITVSSGTGSFTSTPWRRKRSRFPCPTTAPVLIDLIPAFESKSTMGDVAGGDPHVPGGVHAIPAGDGQHLRDRRYIHLVTQAFGASSAHRVVFELANGSEVVKKVESPVGPHGMVFDHMMLEDMVGGNYEIRARLLSPDGAELSQRIAPITVSRAPSPPVRDSSTAAASIPATPAS